MRSIAVVLEIETDEDVDNLDFDDFFHAIVFELTSKDIKFTFTRYDEYSSEILELSTQQLNFAVRIQK